MMTFAELKSLRTQNLGWITNHVVTDEINNARFCGYNDSDVLPAHVMATIQSAQLRDAQAVR